MMVGIYSKYVDLFLYTISSQSGYPRFIMENFTKVAWQPRNVSTLRKSIERLFLDQDGGKVPQTSPWKLGKKVHGNHWEDANLERIIFKETVDRRVEFFPR